MESLFFLIPIRGNRFIRKR